MSNYQELIRDMPSIPAHKKMASDMSGAMMNVIFKKISDDLAKINKSLEEYKHPIIKIPDLPDSVDVNLSKADIAELTDREQFPKSISVDNLKDIKFEANYKQITDAIDRLKGYLHQLKVSEVKVSNLKDIKIPENVLLPKEVLSALSNLKYLSNNANNPLAVRLSDGDKFYDAMNKVSENVKILGGGFGRESAQSAFEAALDNKITARLAGQGRLALSDDTTGVVLAADTACAYVDITADTTRIAVGASSSVQMASPTGVIITPNQTPYRVYASNLNEIYVSAGSGAVCYAYYL